MYTTYHLSSAQEVTTDILEAIKANFKSKNMLLMSNKKSTRQLILILRLLIKRC